MREPTEFFVVPDFDFINREMSYKIVAFFDERTDIVEVQSDIKKLPTAQRARLRWCAR